MPFVRNTSCCGLAELANISGRLRSPEQILHTLLRNKHLFHYYDFYTDHPYELRKGAAFFTSNTTHRNSCFTKFAALVKEKGLGTVTRCRRFRNPNTSHLITLYLWIFDQDALTEYRKNL